MIPTSNSRTLFYVMIRNPKDTKALDEWCSYVTEDRVAAQQALLQDTCGGFFIGRISILQ